MRGLTGQRHTTYSYDDRSRVRGSVAAASGFVPAPPPGGTATAPGASAETPDAADFRLSQARAPMLDAAAASVLTQRGVDTSAIDPPSQTAIPAPGHKIGTWSRGPSTRTFDFGGKSELLDDGQFRYHYDAKGRLEWAAEHATASNATIRRILYTYDANNRLVGRTAQAATVTSLPPDYDNLTWNLETRRQFIDADGIPAEMTFVWDPISDRIITVVRAGDSKVPGDPNNNVLKQIIHGDMGYDDPLEVTSVDTSVLVAPGQAQPVNKLYPIYDEAAGGTLQVAVNRNGEVVARSLNNDPFGGSELDLAGAAVDHMEIRTTKDTNGALDSVTVTMRSTEQLAAATVNSGARLAVVDGNGALVRAATVPPALVPNDPYTVQWTLTAAQWATLSDTTPVNSKTPVSLSIAATTTLRAALWKVDLPILPPPDWATASKPVFSSGTLAMEVRESLTNVAAAIAATNASETRTTVTYDVANLGLLGSSGGNPDIESMLTATFQAQPFAEPFTRKFYVRERWFDPQTGAWLTPDPLGYKDSSNLYAYAGGDPVNGRDATGMQVEEDPKEDAEEEAILYSHGIDPMTGRRISEIEEEEEREEALNRLRISVGLGRKTAGEMSKEEQEEFIRNARRLRSDPAYRAQVRKSTEELQRMALPRALREQIDEAQEELKEGSEVNIAPRRIGPAGNPSGRGIVYLRIDRTGQMKPYVGQAISEARYNERQIEHARAHPGADFEFSELGRAEPGGQLDKLEEDYIRAGGGPTNRGNPNGELSNRRVQMRDPRYKAAGGTVRK